MSQFLKRHSLLTAYAFVILLLFVGIASDSGSQYLGLYALFVASFLLFYATGYFGFGKLVPAAFSSNEKGNGERIGSKIPLFVLATLVVITAIGHFIYLGSIPTFEALKSNDYYYIIHLRRITTFHDNQFWRYASSFMMKATIPFVILLGYKLLDRKKFLLLLTVMVFYSIALLHKSYVVVVLLPVIAYMLLSREWKHAAQVSGVVAASLVFLVIVANPALRMSTSELETNSEYKLPSAPSTFKIDTSKSSLRLTIESLNRRVFVVPGFVVSRWFVCVPDSLPFLDGCGYRFIAKPKGCEFRNYPHELWQYVHPAYHKVGRKGTVNTASFMYDYVNWGWKGLIWSGLILGLFLAGLERLFTRSWKAKVAINLPYVLLLSSTSLFTLLLSGGWGLMLVLYFILGRKL